MANARILVVDDDMNIVHVVQAYLEKGGYEVLTACNGLDALDLTRQKRPDLIVLDLMLPKMDGLDICRLLRGESNQVPIIMLTARTTEEDRLVGLEAGADDYITKPFSPRELVARVSAVLRRHVDSIARSPTRVVIGDIAIDLVDNRVLCRGQLIHLSSCEWGLLRAMAKNPGKVFTHQELLAHLKGLNYPNAETSLDTHVMNIRRHIEPDARQPRYIKNVHGVGYKLSENIED